jgi:glycogen operon protein
VSKIAARLLGSPDIYSHQEREPEQSVNFVTCHDGFTLNDLVSYDRKHNEANGQNDLDGMDENLSWNCGAEGEVSDPAIEALRNRQVKNFLTLNLLAVGTPMLLMGDEVRRTQRGNNNAYCQDNEISWFDWGLLKKHADVYRSIRMMLAFRARREVIIENPRLTLNELLRQARIQWHGVVLNRPDWSEDSHSIALTVGSLNGRFALHAMLNAYWETLSFELPSIEARDGRQWRRWIDTGRLSPDDICAWEDAEPVTQSKYAVAPRSTVILLYTA